VFFDKAKTILVIAYYGIGAIVVFLYTRIKDAVTSINHSFRQKRHPATGTNPGSIFRVPFLIVWFCFIAVAYCVSRIVGFIMYPFKKIGNREVDK